MNYWWEGLAVLTTVGIKEYQCQSLCCAASHPSPREAPQTKSNGKLQASFMSSLTAGTCIWCADWEVVSNLPGSHDCQGKSQNTKHPPPGASEAPLPCVPRRPELMWQENFPARALAWVFYPFDDHHILGVPSVMALRSSKEQNGGVLTNLEPQ